MQGTVVSLKVGCRPFYAEVIACGTRVVVLRHFEKQRPFVVELGFRGQKGLLGAR